MIVHLHAMLGNRYEFLQVMYFKKCVTKTLNVGDDDIMQCCKICGVTLTVKNVVAVSNNT